VARHDVAGSLAGQLFKAKALPLTDSFCLVNRNDGLRQDCH
jgi:hypothetical protein